jgi:hypothetical protein
MVITLTFIGYAPYIYDILKGKTQPHAFTWLSVSLTASVSCALQIVGGAGVGAWPMVVVTGICILVFVLSLWRGVKTITVSDVVFLILALLGLCLWLFIKQPLLAIIVITCSSVLAYFPTIRKSWNQPYSETLVSYQITGARHGLSIFALEKLNLLTVLYPAAWMIINIVIISILITRRSKFPKP